MSHYNYTYRGGLFGSPSNFSTCFRAFTTFLSYCTNNQINAANFISE